MNLENIMLSEISQTEPQKTTQCHIYVEYKKTEHMEPEGRTMAARGWRWENGKMLIQGYKLSVIR